MRHTVGVVAGLLLGTLLAGPTWLYPFGEKAVPQAEPSLFFRTAAAAPFWSGWWGDTATPLQFDEMYSGASARGLQLSDKLIGLDGKTVQMTGFMAPPLKPTIAFFVLTQTPMAICPFCSTDADWPNNIVVVKLSEPVTALPFDQPISVTGTLEVGSQVDEETGFVSLVRIRASKVGVVE